MDIRVHARHVEVPGEIRDLAERKLAGLEALLPPDAVADVELSEERNPRIADAKVAEVTIVARGHVLRARANGRLFRQAITQVTRTMRTQVGDWHHRRRAHPHRAPRPAA
jgi:ribosomal subunit interface protein